MNLKKKLRKIKSRIIKLSLSHKPAESVFTYIYANNSWGHAESVSGHGSAMAKTENVRKCLPKILGDYTIESLLDLPCGDFYWMKTIDLSGIRYVGADIVQRLISNNQQAYQSTDRQFVHCDVTRELVSRFDLILCRDLLVHLPITECLKVLATFIASESTYLLTTTYPNQQTNPDIKPGKWRPINLQAAPFYFPQPLHLIEDGGSDPDEQDYGKHLGLWRISDLGAGDERLGQPIFHTTRRKQMAWQIE